MSLHDVVHLHPQSNVLTKFKLTPYAFWDIAQTTFSNSISLWQDQRLNQSHSTTLHTYTPQTNVPPKFQLPTPYGFWDTAQKNFFPLPALQPSICHGSKQYLDSLKGVKTKSQPNFLQRSNKVFELSIKLFGWINKPPFSHQYTTPEVPLLFSLPSPSSS